MAKDKFDKAFEDMKSGKIKGPTNDDMGPLSKERKEALSSKVDVTEMPESKARFLRSYGQGLSDAKTQFKEAGNIPKSSMEELGPGIFGIGASSDQVAKGNILGRQEMRDAIKKERARAGMKKGGAIKVKKMASGGKTSQLAKANGIAVRGKTRGKIC
jgi:hypothetical protein